MSETNSSVLLDALDKRWNEYHEQLKLSRREASREAVHDLRVATRRFLSVIELLRFVAPHPRLQRMRKILNDHLDKLEELRDTQVVLAEISEVVEELPEAKPFLNHLEKREKRLLSAAEKQIHLLKPGNLIKRVSTIRKSAVKLSETEQDLDQLLLVTIDDAYALVLHRSRFLDRAQTATIHRLRIAFRKFRYLVEILYPILPGFPKKNLNILHEFQGLMGNIQDIEILMYNLAEFVEKDSSYDQEPARLYFQQRHAEAVATFFQDAPKVKTFWRSSRTTSFPWRLSRRKKEPIQNPSTFEKKEDLSGEKTTAKPAHKPAE